MVDNLNKLNQLIDFVGVIRNEMIDLSDTEIVFSNFGISHIEFNKCHIKAKKIRFNDIINPNLTIRFEECIIDSEIEFKNCRFDNLEFYNIEQLKSLSLRGSYELKNPLTVNRLYFINHEKDEIFLNINLEIFNSEFNNEVLIENLNQSSGHTIIENSSFGKNLSENEYFNFNFGNSVYTNFCMSRNKFYRRVTFFKSEFRYDSDYLKGKKYRNTMFYDNVFQEISFLESKFKSICMFWECKFENLAHFEAIKNLHSADLQFINCTFEKYLSLDRATLYKIVIQKCDLRYISSFQDTIFNIVDIDKSLFEKNALFDNIMIKNLNDCNRKTIRTIKQQLQKSENKIDYNRFRAYELAAYYRELNWKWKDGFKDKFILAATWLVTGFEHSWRRALGFTLASAIVSYTIFYISENYYLTVDFGEWQPFASSYFRFLIVTDFYNPLADGRTYIDNTNTVGWFIFILGKIFIAFGIYEMIQAFRKFKA